MLNHIIGIEEAAKQWDLDSYVIKDLCEQQKIVSKKIGETWIVYRDQQHPSKLTEEDVKKLSDHIEWELMSREERLYILDENTRRFYQIVRSIKGLHAAGASEQKIREIWDHLEDQEFARAFAAIDEIE